MFLCPCYDLIRRFDASSKPPSSCWLQEWWIRVRSTSGPTRAWRFQTLNACQMRRLDWRYIAQQSTSTAWGSTLPSVVWRLPPAYHKSWPPCYGHLLPWALATSASRSWSPNRRGSSWRLSAWEICCSWPWVPVTSWWLSLVQLWCSCAKSWRRWVVYDLQLGHVGAEEVTPRSDSQWIQWTSQMPKFDQFFNLFNCCAMNIYLTGRPCQNSLNMVYNDFGAIMLTFCRTSTAIF